MKLFQEIWTWEGSRKAQFGAAGILLCVAQPAVAWPVAAITGAYIIGRAIHDAALARSS